MSMKNVEDGEGSSDHCKLFKYVAFWFQNINVLPYLEQVNWLLSFKGINIGFTD